MKRSPMSPMSAKRRAALPERAAVKQAAHERDAAHAIGLHGFSYERPDVQR